MYFLVILFILLLWNYKQPKEETKIDLEIELEELINQRNAYIVSIITKQHEIEHYIKLGEKIKKINQLLNDL
jgi:hypothetical protein